MKQRTSFVQSQFTTTRGFPVPESPLIFTSKSQICHYRRLQMGCFPSKKRPTTSSNSRRNPRLEPCGPPAWQPDEQQVKKLVKKGFAEADVRSAPQDVNGDENLAIKKLRSAKRASTGNDKNTKPPSVSRSTKGVRSQRSGGGATMDFKGKKFDASRTLGGKGKKANKGAKSSK